jgi:hypothetical protein
LLSALREKRPKKVAAVLIQHDNAPPHRAARVYQLCDDDDFEVISRAPYSPDLVLLMNFDGFHATQMVDVNVAVFSI